jgi:DHA1 family multidrug resistance protein-like MFS transporter
MVLRSMAAIALFVGLMAFANTPWQLLALRIGQGIFSGFVAPSTTLVSVVAPPEAQGRVTGSLQTALAAGAIVGPALGGVAVSSGLGLRWVFAGVAVLATLAGLLVLAFAREPEGLQQKDGGARRGVGGVLPGVWRDVRVVLQSRDVRAALLIVFTIQFALGATNPLLEIFVRDVSGPDAPRTSAAGASLLFSVMAAVNLPAMPLWGRYGDRVGHRAAMLRCSLASAAAFALHGIAPSFALLFGARALLGAATAGVTPAAYGIAAGEIAVDRRGSAFGTLFSARTLAVALSAMAGGYASRWIGIRGLFVIGGLLVLAALLGLRWRARVQRPA